MARLTTRPTEIVDRGKGRVALMVPLRMVAGKGRLEGGHMVLALDDGCIDLGSDEFYLHFSTPNVIFTLPDNTIVIDEPLGKGDNHPLYGETNVKGRKEGR